MKVKLSKEDTKVKMRELPEDTEIDTNKKFPKEDMEEKMKELEEEIQIDVKEKLLKERCRREYERIIRGYGERYEGEIAKENAEEKNHRRIQRKIKVQKKR